MQTGGRSDFRTKPLSEKVSRLGYMKYPRAVVAVAIVDQQATISTK